MSMFIFREFFANIFELILGRGCTMLIEMEEDDRLEKLELTILERLLSIGVEMVRDLRFVKYGCENNLRQSHFL